MKTILLLVDEDEGQQARLEAAIDVARTFGGHIKCLDVTDGSVETGPSGTYLRPVLLEWGRRDEKHMLEEARARLSGEGISNGWIVGTGELAGSIIGAAPLADLIVLSCQFEQIASADMRTVTGDVVVATRRPILAVPSGLTHFDSAGSALIAWDGSLAIEATLRAVMPLLALSSTVTILTIGDVDGDISPQDAATYLARHGIHAQLAAVPAKDRDIDVALQEQCERSHASYCVMGAYGHGRLAEALLGGVTRSMLGSTKVPLVMAH